MLENRMLINEEWGELEYGVPAPRKMTAWEREELDAEEGQGFGRISEPDFPEID